MLSVLYWFPVHARHHAALQHAYHAARLTLETLPGLSAHRFTIPSDRHDSFCVEMNWEARIAFERFTRTWFGVWLVNGMGLPREAFSGPIQTAIGEASTATGSKRAA